MFRASATLDPIGAAYTVNAKRRWVCKSNLALGGAPVSMSLDSMFLI